MISAISIIYKQKNEKTAVKPIRKHKGDPFGQVMGKTGDLWRRSNPRLAKNHCRCSDEDHHQSGFQGNADKVYYKVISQMSDILVLPSKEIEIQQKPMVVVNHHNTVSNIASLISARLAYLRMLFILEMDCTAGSADHFKNK